MAAKWLDRLNVRKKLYTENDVKRMMETIIMFTYDADTVDGVLDDLDNFNAGDMTYELRKAIEKTRAKLEKSKANPERMMAEWKRNMIQ